MALSTLSAVLFAIAYLLTNGSANAPQNGTAAPKHDEVANPEWRIDLRSVIGSVPARVNLGGRRESQGRSETSLWFTNKDRIVVSFVTREGEGRHAELSRRNSPDDSSPLRLRAIFLDANTGQVIKTMSWPTESKTSRIIAVHDGKFLTLCGSELTLYASDLTILKSVTLPPLSRSDWLVRTSPTGKNILLSSAAMRKGSWFWIETDTLKILRSWEESPSGYLTISDEDLAMSTCWWGHQLTCDGSTCVSGPKCEAKVEIRSLSTNWKIIAEGEEHQYPQFASENALFLPGKDTGKIIRPDGQVLFEEPKGRRSWGCWATGLLPSADVARFAIPSCQVKGAVASLDMSGHPVLRQIVVYDISSQIKTQALDVKGPRIQDQMQFAISPDGLRIAILNADYLEVLRLPPLG